MTRLLKSMLLLLTLSFQGCASKETIELTPNNTINLRGEISESSLGKVINEYLKLSKQNNGEKIYIVVNSPGGDVIAGLEFLRFMKTTKNTTLVCLQCISMAHVIFQILPSERLVVSDNTMMAHRARGGISGQLNDGELESRLSNIKAILSDMERQVAERIGISIEEYKQKINNEWWTYGEQSVKEHVADRVVDLKCSQELLEKTEESLVPFIFGSIKVKFYACPLISTPAESSNKE